VACRAAFRPSAADDGPQIAAWCILCLRKSAEVSDHDRLAVVD
jgi:hypothetical protein